MLGFVMLASSFYLVKVFTIDPWLGRFSVSNCEWGGVWSCESVANSEYSALLGVPLSVMGLVWSIVFLLLVRWSMVARHSAFDVFAYSTLGLLFVFNLLYAEYQLGALCYYCTLVHVSIFLAVVISWFLLEESIAQSLRARFYWRPVSLALVFVGVLQAILIIGFWFGRNFF